LPIYTQANTAESKTTGSVKNDVIGKTLTLETGNTTATSTTTDVPAKSGWSTFLLKGNVEKVIYSDGRYIYFNTDGNVLKHNARERVRGQKEFVYVYSSPTRFVIKGDESTRYKIVFESNMRKEIWDDPEGLGLTFTYDVKGRLTSVAEPKYGMGRTETYTYPVTNTYPSKEIIEYYYDDGGGTKETFTFSNYAFDSQENWISRTVNYKKVIESEDSKPKTTIKTYSENRTISYFK